jgi:carboxylesterase
MLPALALLAMALGARASYPRLLERRQRQRRALDETGMVVGAAPIELSRHQAPGILLLHGGGDTPQVLGDLARFLHGQGFSVRVPLLSAHGRALSALSGASAEAWRDDARREYAAMRETTEWVAVVGLSMGGALAIQLAADRKDIPALVLLAPYIAMPAMARRMATTTRYWGWLLPYFSSLGAESIRDSEAARRALGHGILTPAMLRALLDIVDAAEAALPRVLAPTLVIQSREDNRIPPEVAERGFARLGSPEKKFVWTNGAGHVITVDYGHRRVFDLTAHWLEDHLEPGALATEGSTGESDPSRRLDRQPRIRNERDRRGFRPGP